VPVESINPDKCSGCLHCVKFCPMDVLRTEGSRPVVSYREDCQSCYLCVLKCPKGAIDVSPWRVFPPDGIYGIFDPDGKDRRDKKREKR